jgi:hypothetical protein
MIRAALALMDGRPLGHANMSIQYVTNRPQSADLVVHWCAPAAAAAAHVCNGQNLVCAWKLAATSMEETIAGQIHRPKKPCGGGVLLCPFNRRRTTLTQTKWGALATSVLSVAGKWLARTRALLCPALFCRSSSSRLKRAHTCVHAADKSRLLVIGLGMSPSRARLQHEACGGGRNLLFV